MFELMDLALLMVRQHLSGYAWITVIMVAGMAALNGSILYVIDWHALASIILIVVEAPLLGLPLIIYSADLLFNDRPSAIEALKRSWQVFRRCCLNMCRCESCFTYYPWDSSSTNSDTDSLPKWSCWNN